MHAQPGIRRTVGVALASMAVALLGSASFMPMVAVEAELKPDTVRITITANTVTVAPDTVPPGEVMLMVMNNSTEVQDFDLDGPSPNGDPDVELDDIPAGATRTVTTQLRAGTYSVEADDGDGNNERRALLTVR